MSALTAYAARVLAARKDGTTVEVWLWQVRDAALRHGCAMRRCLRQRPRQRSGRAPGWARAGGGGAGGGH